MSEPELTIVIPVYNHTGVYDLVDDFYRLHDKEMFRLIIIDQTAEGLHFKDDAPVHLHIKSYRNLGFSKSMNTGWKLSQTPYTLLANDDARLLNKDWYQAARTCVQKDGVLAVNPTSAVRTWDGGGNPRWFWDIHGDRFDFVKDKPFDQYTDEDYKKLLDIHNHGDGPGTTMFFTLCRTELRDIVGFLDEAYTNNGEDYDLNRRIYLTCRNCQKRKHEHDGDLLKCDYDTNKIFQPYQILTCNHGLIHHQCGVTKQNAVKAKEIDGYKLFVNAQNIFNKKWGSEDCNNPDIYGRNGSLAGNTPWFTEMQL